MRSSIAADISRQTSAARSALHFRRKSAQRDIFMYLYAVPASVCVYCTWRLFTSLFMGLTPGSFTSPSYCQFLLLLLFCGLLGCASYAPCFRAPRTRLPAPCSVILAPYIFAPGYAGAFLFAIDLWFGDFAPCAGFSVYCRRLISVLLR